VPGLGEVDWTAFVDALYESGYEGFVSVEHEDPVWEGSPEKVRQGLVIAYRTLAPLVVA
jgi:sugar phosphate isomerase/epimerase